MLKVLFREKDRKSGAFSLLAGDRDLSTVKVKNAPDERKSKTISAGGTGEIALIELFENTWQYQSIDSDAGIADLYVYFTGLSVQQDNDPASRRCELYCIAEQIFPYMGKQLLTAVIFYVVKIDF